MRILLSHRERLAGLLLMVSVIGVIVFTLGAAIQNRWLEPRVSYYTQVTRGEGLREGSPVLLSGIVVGEVGDLSILPDNRVNVEILVLERHAHRVRVGTKANVRRLLGIGEKRLYLVWDRGSMQELPGGATLPADEPSDLLDAVANIDLEKYMNTMDRAVAAMEVVLSKLEEEKRLERMMEAFDQMGPTMERMNSMLTELEQPMVDLLTDKSVRRTFKGADKVFNDPNTRKMVRGMATTFDPEKMKKLMERTDRLIARFDKMTAKDGELTGAIEGADRLMNDGRMDRMLTAMEQLTDEQKLEKLVDNLSILAEQMALIGPEIPTMSREMTTAMREAVIVLKALQKTWILDDEAREVRRDAKKKKGDDED